ncbi:MAG: iron chelate uptake ABC transporter family permease subunit, partial [Actinomycetota bacterium]
MAGPRHRGVLPALLALVIGMTACDSGSGDARPSAAPGTEFPLTLTDDDGVRVTVPAEPERIVTFAPSNTEIVFALGLGSRLVGVSGDFDDHPPQARAIQHVGGAGEFGVDPNVEKVVSLQPDLFLAISGGEEWKQRLRELGIPVFTLNATDFDDLLADIRTVGRLTGSMARAEALTASMRAAANEVADAIGAEAPTPCFFEAYYPPLTTVGPRTFLYDLLERAGCAPVTAEATSDYPQWSVDRLVAQSPDVYLVSSESGVSVGSVSKRPGFRAIAAVEEGRVYLVNSDLITRPGPRVVDGLEVLAGLLHPTRDGLMLRRRPVVALMILAAVLVVAALVALAFGSVWISPWDSVRLLAWKLHLAERPAGVATSSDVILFQLRLPRVLLAMVVGAALAAAGTVFQALFRNPMADPAIIGVSSGAALGAILVIVAGAGEAVGTMGIPAAAFAGALATGFLVYRLARLGPTIQVPTLLLAGIAVAAVISAVISLIMTFSGQEIRSIYFWLLGGLGARGWQSLQAAAPLVALGVGAAVVTVGDLNLSSLGEERAAQLGLDVERFKRITL